MRRATVNIQAHAMGDMRGDVRVEYSRHGVTIRSSDALGWRFSLTDMPRDDKAAMTPVELLAELRAAIDAATNIDACPTCGRDK